VLVGVLVGVFVGVLVGVLVGVFVGVLVGVFVGVLVGVKVAVLVGVGVSFGGGGSSPAKTTAVTLSNKLRVTKIGIIFFIIHPFL
jgi:hypothetical protein